MEVTGSPLHHHDYATNNGKPRRKLRRRHRSDMMGRGTSVRRSHWSVLSFRRSGEIRGTIPLDCGTAPRLRTDRREQEVNTFLPKENVTQPFCQASSVSMMMNHAEMWRPVHVPWSTMPAVVRIHRPHPSTTGTRAGMGKSPSHCQLSGGTHCIFS